jgi:hypothetical protein
MTDRDDQGIDQWERQIRRRPGIVWVGQRGTRRRPPFFRGGFLEGDRATEDQAGRLLSLPHPATADEVPLFRRMILADL